MKMTFNPQIIIFIGVIIGATGVLISGIGAYLASQQQAKFEHGLRVKSEEITELNKEIVNLVTGGNSFAFVFPVVEPSTNDLVFHLVHQGTYPVFDTEIQIEHPTKDISREMARIEELKQIGTPEAQTEIFQINMEIENFTVKLVKIGTLPVNTTRDIYRIPVPEVQGLYKIKIFSRKGILEQFIKKKDGENKWQFLKVKMYENDGKTTELQDKIDSFYTERNE